MALLLALAVFAGGVVLVVAGADILVDGLLGLATRLRISPFFASAVLSGLEAENIAVGLAAGWHGDADVALGTAYGGTIVVVALALGGGALIAPLRLRLPREVSILCVLAAVLSGLPLLFVTTPRWIGAILVVAGVVLLGRLAVVVPRPERPPDDDRGSSPRPFPVSVALAVGAVAVITIAGNLVASGAERLVAAAGLSASLVGSVVTPVAIEAEEVARQVVPTRRGYPDLAAGNLVGTVLWFCLLDLGLVALVTPVRIPTHVRTLDWPACVVLVAVAAAVLARGRVERRHGALLLSLGLATVAAATLTR